MRDFGMLIPPFFTCPISLQLFSDPVTLCTGQTYDRPNIEKWVAAGNLTCPVTMQKLHDLSMIPNHTLKHLIDQWLQKGSHNYEQIYEHDNQDHNYHVSISSLKHILESQESSLEQKLQAVEQVRYLSEDLNRESEGFIQLGFFSLLLSLVFGAKNSQEMMCLIEKSLDCVLKMMPFCSMKDLNNVLIEESKFENFKLLFQDGNFMVKINISNLVEAIFNPSSCETEDLSTKIAKESKVLQLLIRSLDDYKQNSEVSEAGIKAILAILSSPQQSNRENLIKQGLIQSLVNYILEVEGKEKNLAAKATRALELALNLQSGKETFLVNEVQNGVKALIKMVFRVSGDDQGSESAVNCLMNLCSESLEVSESAICGGILTQLLFLLQSQCCGRVKTRARMLLKLLRSMWSKDPKHV